MTHHTGHTQHAHRFMIALHEDTTDRVELCARILLLLELYKLNPTKETLGYIRRLSVLLSLTTQTLH